MMFESAFYTLLEFDHLKLLWWIIVGFLFGVVLVMDGLNCGVLTMMPFLGKNDSERRVIINSIGPVWEANQVWLILAGGALFAAWPMLYAVTMSSFYLAIFLLLLFFIMRPTGFKLRSKIDANSWRSFCDACLFLGGLFPAFLLGVVIGNMFMGLSFSLDSSLNQTVGDGFFDILNPFSVFCGLIVVVSSLKQGAIYLLGKVGDDILLARIRCWLTLFTASFLVMFLLAIFSMWHIPGYMLDSVVDFKMDPNPNNYKVVTVGVGAWIKAYKTSPWLIIWPVLCCLCTIVSYILCKVRKILVAFLISAIGVLSMLFSVGATMHPFWLPSKANLASSLLIWDSSSSRDTLYIMTIITIIFLPIVLGYTVWVYTVFNYKLTVDSVVKLGKNEAY